MDLGRTLRRTRRQLWGVLGWVGWFLRRAFEAPFRALRLFATFLLSNTVTWWRSRRWRQLLWGLPSVIAIGGCGYFAINELLATPGRRAESYVQAGNVSLRNQAWDTATLYLERAYELGLRDPATMLNLAVAAERSGDTARKVAMLEILAPEDKSTYAPAHTWKASELLQSQPMRPDDLNAAEKHLRHVITLEPSNEAAHAVLGDLYFQRGFFDGAVAHLARAPKSVAKYQLLHAKACVLTGRQFEAEASAKLAKQLAVAELNELPTDLARRLQLAEVHHFLEEFEESLRVLGDGVRNASSEASVHQLSARVYLSWADKELSKGRLDRTNRRNAFRLIAAAMDQNPDDRDVFDRMMEIIELEDEASSDARDFLVGNIATGRAVGLSHLLLGTSFLESGKSQESSFHLEQAFKLLPRASIVANNLAWQLAHQEKPDLKRAYQLIQTVLEKHPGVPAYVDTRAHIFLRAGKYREAVDDFQVSLTQFASEPAVHAGLLEAYTKLGLNDLAAKHAEILRVLKENGQRPPQ